MKPKHIEFLEIQAQTHSQAYVRNLVGVENAVLAGQFNVAKILRAAAYTQRTLAMTATRLLNYRPEGQALLTTITDEVQTNLDLSDLDQSQNDLNRQMEQFIVVQQRLEAILQRALQSLSHNADVLETDVHQYLNGCQNCGNLVEDSTPDACDICGALGVEFERFGPFYAATPERLGQLVPEQMIAIIKTMPDQVAALIASVDDVHLSRKPTADEWCVKELVGHMTETHKSFVNRAKSILQNTVYTQAAPPWKLHEGQGYEMMTANELVTHLRQACQESLALTENFTAQDWSRTGVMLGQSRSMLDLGTWLANHDRGHFAQIEQLLSADE